MAKPVVCITRRIPAIAEEILSTSAEVRIWKEAHNPSTSELKDFCRDASGILCMLSDNFNKNLIESLPQLKVIANYAVGYNNLDLKTLHARGIRAGNTPDVLTDATADLAFTLLMMCSRNAIAANRNVHSGEWRDWEPLGFMGKSLRGKTCGVIGFGRIGRSFASLVHAAFGMHILTVNRSQKETNFPVNYLPFREVLKNADIISVHCPLTKETHKLFDQDAFSAMKAGSIFINTARGEIHSNDALYTALKSGHLFAAGVDVNDPEPMPVDEPLLSLGNFTALPHIGSATEEARFAMAEVAAKNILAALEDGKMPAEIETSSEL